MYSVRLHLTTYVANTWYSNESNILGFGIQIITALAYRIIRLQNVLVNEAHNQLYWNTSRFRDSWKFSCVAKLSRNFEECEAEGELASFKVNLQAWIKISSGFEGFHTK